MVGKGGHLSATYTKLEHLWCRSSSYRPSGLGCIGTQAETEPVKIAECLNSVLYRGLSCFCSSEGPPSPLVSPSTYQARSL